MKVSGINQMDIHEMSSFNTIESRIVELQSQLTRSKMQQKRYELQLRTLVSMRTKISQSVEQLSTSYQREVKQMEMKIKKLQEENRKLVKKNNLYKMSIQNFQKTILEKDKIISTILAKEFTSVPVMRSVDVGLLRGEDVVGNRQKGRNIVKSNQKIAVVNINSKDDQRKQQIGIGQPSLGIKQVGEQESSPIVIEQEQQQQEVADLQTQYQQQDAKQEETPEQKQQLIPQQPLELQYQQQQQQEYRQQQQQIVIGSLSNIEKPKVISFKQIQPQSYMQDITNNNNYYIQGFGFNQQHYQPAQNENNKNQYDENNGVFSNPFGNREQQQQQEQINDNNNDQPIQQLQEQHQQQNHAQSHLLDQNHQTVDNNQQQIQTVNNIQEIKQIHINQNQPIIINHLIMDVHENKEQKIQNVDQQNINQQLQKQSQFDLGNVHVPQFIHHQKLQQQSSLVKQQQSLVKQQHQHVHTLKTKPLPPPPKSKHTKVPSLPMKKAPIINKSVEKQQQKTTVPNKAIEQQTMPKKVIEQQRNTNKAIEQLPTQTISKINKIPKPPAKKIKAPVTTIPKTLQNKQQKHETQQQKHQTQPENKQIIQNQPQQNQFEQQQKKQNQLSTNTVEQRKQIPKPPPVKKSLPAPPLPSQKPKGIRQKNLQRYKTLDYEQQLINPNKSQDITSYFQTSKEQNNNKDNPLVQSQQQPIHKYHNEWQNEEEGLSPEFGMGRNDGQINANLHDNIIGKGLQNQHTQVQLKSFQKSQHVQQPQQSKLNMSQNKLQIYQPVQTKPQVHNISHSSITRSKKSKRQPTKQPYKIISFDDNQTAQKTPFNIFASQHQQSIKKSQQNPLNYSQVPNKKVNKSQSIQNNYDFNFKQDTQQNYFKHQTQEDHEMHGMVDESSIEQIDDLSMISGSIFPQQNENFQAERFHSEKKKRKSSQADKQEVMKQMMAPPASKKMSKKKGKRDNVQTISFV